MIQETDLKIHVFLVAAESAVALAAASRFKDPALICGPGPFNQIASYIDIFLIVYFSLSCLILFYFSGGKKMGYPLLIRKLKVNVNVNDVL